MGRKFLSFFISIYICFGFSLSKELIIEDKGSYIFIKNLPETKVPNKKSRKYKNYREHNKKKHKFFIAKKNGKIFHKPDCRFAKRIKHKVKFKSRKQAIKRGYRPCKICKP